jgi:uncharacterized protein (DUF362 family)
MAIKQIDDIPFVAVQKGEDPYQNTEHVLEQLTLPDLSGKRVLVKPNAGRQVQPRKGITTEPQVVAAACDFFIGLGANVSVGESTIVGVKPLDCLESTGIAAVARERNIPVIDLDELPACKTPVKGRVLDHLKICGAIPSFDYIVSVPVMKTHMHCKVTLSLKNMKGCLRGREKVRLHQLPQPGEHTGEKTLDLAVADMSTVLSPDLAIIDGTICMEGLGPSGGETKQLNLVLASTDYLSADLIAARIMGFEPEEVPHLRLSAKLADHSLDLNDISVSPAQWRELIDPFERPPQKLSLEFPNIEVHDRESCSACVSTLMLFLKRYYNELGDYFPLQIAIGKAHENLPSGTLCIGNCTSKACKHGIFVKGCPPVSSDILQTLKDITNKGNP